MNWLINKFKSFSLTTQAAFEGLYSILFLMMYCNAIAYSINEITIAIIISILSVGTLWYYIYDIVKKIKESGKVKSKK